VSIAENFRIESTLPVWVPGLNNWFIQFDKNILVDFRLLNLIVDGIAGLGVYDGKEKRHFFIITEKHL